MTALEERNRMLTEANRKLLERANLLAQRAVIGKRAVDMLETCCGDWNEARDLIKQWRAM
jgi:hypothetical protein